MAKMEYLQLAHKFDSAKHSITGCYVSEKLDGLRCFWDSGITRGLECRTIPWANTEKDGRYVIPPLASGLWTRYGKTIQAPGWFLDLLPKFPLDGELWMGRNSFQETSSVVKQLYPDNRWRDIVFMVFDSPGLRVFAQDRVIKTPLFNKKITGGVQFVLNRFNSDFGLEPRPFEITYGWLKANLIQNQNIQLVEQKELSFSTQVALKQIDSMLDQVCTGGGEGLMARRRMFAWECTRNYNTLKIKNTQDSEGTVIGYIWGRAGKLMGMMGAMLVEWNGKKFELSGFTDQERELAWISINGTPWIDCVIKAQVVGYKYPGQKCSPELTNRMFPIGSKVTFKYRELTNAGMPKEARYWRKWETD